MPDSEINPSPYTATSKAAAGFAVWVRQIESRVDAIELRLDELSKLTQRLKQAMLPPPPPPSDLPLTPQMWCLLKYLSGRGDVTVSTLADHCKGPRGGCDRRVVKTLLLRLEEWKLVGRSRDNQGRRWHLTNAGFYRVNNHIPPA